MSNPLFQLKILKQRLSHNVEQTDRRTDRFIQKFGKHFSFVNLEHIVIHMSEY